MYTRKYQCIFHQSHRVSWMCFWRRYHSKTADRRRCDLCPSNRRYVNLSHLRCLLMDTLQGRKTYPPWLWTGIFEDRWLEPNFRLVGDVFICREGICFERFLLKDEASSIEWTLRPMIVAYSRWPLKWWMSPHGWGIFAEVVDRKQRLSVEWASWLVFLMNFAGNLSSDYFILVTSYWGLYNFFTEGF